MIKTQGPAAVTCLSATYKMHISDTSRNTDLFTLESREKRYSRQNSLRVILKRNFFRLTRGHFCELNLELRLGLPESLVLGRLG